MKRLFILSFVGGILFSSITAIGAQDDGKTVSNKCLLIFRHGSDWNKSGETILRGTWKTLTANKSLSANWNFGTHNTLEKMTDKVKKENENAEKLGKVTLRSFPAVSLHNTRGQCFALIQGLPYNITADELKEKIDAARKNYEQVDSDIKKALSLSGDAKTTALANCLLSLDQYNELGVLKDKTNFAWLFEELYKADPNDQLGYKWRFNFNGEPLAFQVQAMVKEKKISDAENLIATQLSKSGYKNLALDQQQQIQLLKFVLHKDNSAQRAELIDLLRKVYAMQPTSHWGYGAAGYLQTWNEPIDVAIPYGWNSKFCKSGSNVWEIIIGTRKHFHSPNYDYKITFTYEQGSDSLGIEKIELREGENILAATSKDEKPQLVNEKNPAATFTLIWNDERKEPKNYRDLRLFVYYKAQGTNSQGKINVKREH